MLNLEWEKLIVSWKKDFNICLEIKLILPSFLGCSLSYDLQMYPLLDTVNCKINELQNAAVKKLKTQLSYVTPGNFMRHRIFYLWNRNWLKRKL